MVGEGGGWVHKTLSLVLKYLFPEVLATPYPSGNSESCQEVERD